LQIQGSRLDPCDSCYSDTQINVLNPYGILCTGLLVLINVSSRSKLTNRLQIAEKEINRKKEVLQTLEYICQQFGHLKVVKSVPPHIGQDVQTRLMNRAMDVRSACILYLAAHIKHDKIWLGTIGNILPPGNGSLVM